MINWQYFPRSDECPPHLAATVGIFERSEGAIASDTHVGLTSNEALACVRPGLESLGYEVESGKHSHELVQVPVLFGPNGRVDKQFQADAWDRQNATVVEVEAGRAVDNYQFLKDLFQACMMHDIRYLVLAVRNAYRGSNDWQRVVTFFETMYSSSRLSLPLDGVLVIGY